MSDNFELHSHCFTSGPRSTAHYEGGVWVETKFEHSHPGGGVPHSHPNTGPAFFGYRKPKTTTKPKGEQMPFVEATEEQSSFDLVITDSAIHYVDGEAVPIGNMPLEEIIMPAADRIQGGFRMKCNVRDERNHGSPDQVA